MQSEFKFLWVTEPFYNPIHESKLPSLEDTQKHFINFLDEYFKVGIYLDKEYKNSMNNFEVYLGTDGEYINVDKNEYDKIHSYYQRLKSYYQDLLNSCRRKYGFWLNDIMPDKYKVTTKKKRKAKAIN
jgi:hypothetical protein